MKLNLTFLEKILGDKRNRNIKFDKNKDIDLSNELNITYSLLSEWIETSSCYTRSRVASFIISVYRWIAAEKNNKLRFNKDYKKRPKVMQYEVREIILADFGATNFGVEASFEHPAIVLHNGFYFLVVIPGSTGRSGKGDYILDADKQENFHHKTGIQIDQIRVIDKSRVIKKTGKKVSPEFMNKINEMILEKYLQPVKKDIDKLKDENLNLAQKVKDLEALLAEKSKEEEN